MLLSRNAFAFLLLLSAATPRVQANKNPIENLIPQWLPQCFTGADAFNPLSIIECIRENAGKTCLERMTFEGTIADVVDCVNTTVTAGMLEAGGAEQSSSSNPVGSFLSNNLGINLGGGSDPKELVDVGRFFVGSALACIDPYATCVQETIEAAVEEKLDPCLRETVADLVECGRTHGEACQAACRGRDGDEATEGGLSFPALPQVSTCASIQEGIVDPLCGVVSCCEPCVSKVEALMECVVNQQLEQVPTLGGGDCKDLACPVVQKRERRLGQKATTTSSRTLSTGATTDVEKCLEFAPGLTGDDSAELSARSAVFMPCVSDSFLKAVEEGSSTETTATSGGSSPPTGESDAESEGAEEESNTESEAPEEEGTDKTDANSGGSSAALGAFSLIAGAAISFYAL